MSQEQDNDILQLVVEGITVENTEQIYNEIAEGADLSGLFEFMVDFAIQTALGDQLQFELDFADAIGEALGAPVTLNINTVRRGFGFRWRGLPFSLRNALLGF